jgi:type II secretory ATPase GspE/PulE/Tfp pilus assembly ATPase PilB-like protein
METKFKLDEIQDALESYIKFISENYSDHGKCGLIIRSLRGAADDIHVIRFDQAISEKYRQNEILRKEEAK